MKISRQKLNLAQARAGVTATELCRQSGIPYVTFSQVRRGVREPRPDTLGRIAKALGVDPAELLETED